VRRLFSTFARGWPGIGLLAMRLVAGTAFCAEAAALFRGAPPLTSAVWLLALAAGVGLIAGIWTPVAGSLVATLSLWLAVTRAEDPLAQLLLATMGAALALVGPGAFSIDARLFGWKRIEVGDRRR
jgi:hypothetical protein